jgi:hypothetical protein
LLARRWSGAAPATRRFWLTFIGGSLVVGVAAHGGRDPWGNTAICEQPLVLLALAFLSAQWSGLGPRWRLALIIGAVVDLVFGILLQFGAQSYLLDRWLTPTRPPAEIFASYAEPGRFNLEGKQIMKLSFFGDTVPASPALLLALLAALLGLALARLRPAPLGSNRP